MNKYIFLSLIVIFHSCLFAQNKNQATCEEQFELIKEYYEQGRIENLNGTNLEKIIDNRCINTLEKNKKEELFSLLVNANLYLNENEEAVEWMEKLLKNNPEYRIKSDDSNEFKEIYKKMRTSPIFIAGVKLGGNLTSITLLKSFSLDNIPNKDASYNLKANFQVGANFGIPIIKNIDLMAEINLALRSYSYQNTILNYAQTSLDETQTVINIPVYAKIFLGKKYNYYKPFKPFIIAGASANLLLTSSASVSRNDKRINATTLASDNVSVTGPTISTTAIRNPLQISILAGIGLEYKRGRGNFIFDLKYEYGIFNTVIPEKRYTSTELLYKYGHLDNDFILSAFSFTVGYLYPLYNPKPKKGAFDFR